MSLRRIYDIVVRQNVRVQGVFGRFFGTELAKPNDEITDITNADEKPMYNSPIDDPEFQEELAKKRNKSRLYPQHRNILMGVPPYKQSMAVFHNTVKYKRRMLGRYGLKANDVPAGFAWPTVREVWKDKEYEKVAFPLSLQERWKKIEKKKQITAEQTQERERIAQEKLEKMDQWTAELRAKIAKKEADLTAARLRKDRLVDEVRRHFGFKISIHDARFKEMLAQKEKEEKKKKKEAKKKAKMDKITNMFKNSKENSQEEVTNSTKSVE